MTDTPVNLGVCFTGRQLYYAVSRPDGSHALSRVGKIDFNFEIVPAIIQRDPELYQGVLDVIDRLVKKNRVSVLRCLIPATLETWAALPKSVYDQPSEREAYLRILKHGENRQQLEPFWFDLSNRDFRFLAVRNKLQTAGYHQLGDSCSFSELCSEFEVGLKWMGKTETTESFKTIGCYDDHIAIASFVLGKLRAATHIRYAHIDDLSYLWLQQASNLGWMNGVHDTIYFYGTNVYKVNEVLQYVFDSSARQVRLDNLADMQVEAPEETYGFNLEEAFPAITLAL